MEKIFVRREYNRTEHFRSVGTAVKVGETSKSFKVEVINISANGLLFEIDKECVKGEVLRFDLEIDTNMTDSTDKFSTIKMNVRFNAEVNDIATCSASGKNTYRAKITDISAGQRTRLDELVNAIELLVGG